jgi:hypothetical protein
MRVPNAGPFTASTTKRQLIIYEDLTAKSLFQNTLQTIFQVAENKAFKVAAKFLSQRTLQAKS